MSEKEFAEFYADLKRVEAKDANLTPKQQIERLLRPGHTYRNLNPYDVLQVDPDTPFEEVRKRYRRLSVLIHPDKNLDDVERARQAFDYFRKAFSLLEDVNSRKQCYEAVEEARVLVKRDADARRSAMRKKGVLNIVLDEDDPEKLRKIVENKTMKVFADREIQRKQLQQKISDDTAKKAAEEKEEAERLKHEEEVQQNFEDSRQTRANSWLDFQKQSSTPTSTLTGAAATASSGAGGKAKKAKKAKYTPLGFRPPKNKPETR